MISRQDAVRLKALITEYAEAKEAASWSGAQDPRDADALKLEFEIARRDLEDFIRTITGKD